MEKMSPLYHTKQQMAPRILQSFLNALSLCLTVVYLLAAWQFGRPFLLPMAAVSLCSILLAIAIRVKLRGRTRQDPSSRLVRIDLTTVFFFVYSTSLTAIALQMLSEWSWNATSTPNFSAFYVIILSLISFGAAIYSNGHPRRTLLLGALVQMTFASWLYIYLRNSHGYLLFGMNAVLAAVWGVMRVRREGRVLRTPLDTPLVAFILVGLLSLGFAAYIYQSLHQFLFMATEILIGYVLIMAVVDRRELNVVAVCFATICGGVFSLAAIGKFVAFWRHLGLERALVTRYGVGAVHPNRLGPLLAVALFVSLGLLLAEKRWRWRAIAFILVLVQAVGLALTYSSSGFLGFVAGMVTFAGFVLLGRMRGIIQTSLHSRLGRLLFVFSAVGLIVMGALFARPMADKAQRVLYNVPSLQGRLRVWSLALPNIFAHPVVGIGLDNYYVRSPFTSSLNAETHGIIRLPGGLTLTALTPAGYIDDIDALVASRRAEARVHPHNMYLVIAEGMGLIGLAVFIWLLASLLVSMWRARRNHDFYQVALTGGCLAGLCAVLVGGLIEAQVFYPIWILAGLIVAIDRVPASNLRGVETSPPARKLGFSPLALLSGIFILSLAVMMSAFLADSYEEQGLVLQRNGNLAQASLVLRRAQRAESLNADWRVKLAGIYQMMGKPEAALAEYQAASRLKKDFALLHAQMGRLYVCMGQLDLALQEFQTALALDPAGLWGGEHYSDLGIVYALTDRREEAIKVFKQAFGQEPAAVSRPYWQTDEEDGGTVLRLAGSDYCLPEANAFYNKATATQLRIDVDEILEAIQVEASGPLPPAIAEQRLRYLGELYLKLNRYPQAIHIFERLKAQGQHGVYDFKLGMIYARMGKLDLAEEKLEAALETISGHWVLYNELGRVYAQQGRYTEAERMFRKAVFYYGVERPEPLARLIDLYLTQGQTQKAIAAMKREVFLRDHPHVRFRLAEELQSVGRDDEAIQVYRQIVLSALRRETTQATDWRLRLPMQRVAEIHMRKGLSMQSIAASKALLGRYANTFNGHIAMANLLQAIGQKDSALQELLAARAMEPERPDWYAALSNASLWRMMRLLEYDLQGRLVQAHSPEASHVAPHGFEISGDYRQVLYAHPPSSVMFPVQIGSPALLVFGIGVDPEVWDSEGDGVLFEVFVDDGSAAYRVFSSYLDPKHIPNDRRWVDSGIDLSRFTGKEVKIRFATSSGPIGDDHYDWAGWSSPTVVGLPDQRSQAGPILWTTDRPE